MRPSTGDYLSVVLNQPPDLTLPDRVALADPDPFLGAISRAPWCHLDLDRLQVVEMWALVALCAISRRESPDDRRCDVYHRGRSNVGKFAFAVGFDSARDGSVPSARGSHVERTVPIQRVTFDRPVRIIAAELARVAIPAAAEEASRDALAYVIDELLRNVLQHSGDALGAVVGAQRMDAGKGGYARATVQVAVADAGRGILESLRRSHVVEGPEEALEKAIRPHVSGVFPEGQMGGSDNAGLGLFFTSEMAKLTAGRLLLATRGGSLFLDGDEHEGKHRLRFLEPTGTGYPGTLAVFELPIEIVDRDALMDVIRQRATERASAPVARRWLAYETPPAGVEAFAIRDVGDDTDAAQSLAERMTSCLSASRTITIDFAGIRIATQSLLHALLFRPVRVGWAMGARIYVINAEPAVRSGLTFLESYALT